MTDNRYDDELLSTIIDGDASAETIAAVEADAVASQRLIDLRAAVDHVAAPVPEATPERRSASIAAAMAAATPASPDVTSLSAKRHEKEEAKRSLPTGWLIAAAAAVLLFVLAIPVFLSTEVTETASDTAADAVEEAAVDGDAGAGSLSAESGAVAGDEEAMEEEEEEEEVDEAMEDEEAAEEVFSDDLDEAAEEQEAAVEAAAADAAAVDLDLEVVPSIEELQVLIDDSTLAPQLDRDDILAIEALQARSTSGIDEVLATEVNPECLLPPEGVTNPTPYSLVVLDPFAGAAQLVIVEFGDDGTTRLLDAETCGVIG